MSNLLSMKTPPKPFTVEVKHSRSSSSTAQPVRLQPPLLIEASVAAAPASPSQARQRAEQAFKALAAGSSDKREKIATAESVFRATTGRVLTITSSGEELAADGPQAQTSPAKEMVPPKPRKPRASKKRVATAPAKKGRNLKAPDAVAVEALAMIASAQRQQDPPVRVPETLPLVPVAQVAPQSLAAEPEHQNTRQNWGWGPGERWKKRLRHLR
jgi:hypothetical protein